VARSQRAEIAPRDAPRGARQTIYRVADPLGHVITDARAKEREEQCRERNGREFRFHIQV